MKLLFAGSRYYPEGGVYDLKMVSSEQNCKEHFERIRTELYEHYGNYDMWGHIVNATTFEVELHCSLDCKDEVTVWCTHQEK